MNKMIFNDMNIKYGYGNRKIKIRNCLLLMKSDELKALQLWKMQKKR